MNDAFYHIVINDEIILSNLPEDLMPEVVECPAETQYKECPIRQLIKRQKKLKTPDGNGFIYFCSYDPQLTKKTFAYYFDALYSLYNSFSTKIEHIRRQNKELAKNDLHRLQHNVNSYNAKIQDDIDSLISLQDTKMSEWANILQNTTKVIENNPRKAAVVLLKVAKNISLVNSEMNVYDFLENPDSEIQFFSHPIHKVVKLSLQPFFLDFVENRISPRLGECYETVEIDYPSISVVLGHIWSNAIKYTCGGTDINISFSKFQDYIDVEIECYSLYIETDEIEKIFQEGYSGKWSHVADKSGNGIGMYYIKYLTHLNNGDFYIYPGDSPTYINKLPYTKNKFVLRLKRTQHKE